MKITTGLRQGTVLNRSIFSLFVVAALVSGFFVANSIRAFTSPAAVNLGAAGDFVILSQSGISNTGTTAITGDIGVSPIGYAAITGFTLTPTIPDGTNTFSTSALVSGHIFAANYTEPTPTNLGTAVGAIGTAITSANSRTADSTNLTGIAASQCVAGTCDLAGLTLAPGVYTFTGPGNVVITGDVTLNGSASDVWIFQIPGTLNISSSKKVLLTGGAVPANVFWSVAGATTLGTNSTFEGNILEAGLVIALQTGATLHGRALSQFAVTLDTNIVSATAPAPACTTTCYVDAVNGNNTNGGTSTSDAKKTIQAAVTQVSSGGTINVAAGNYTEQVNITKPLTLTGAGKDTTHINTPEPSTMTIYDAFGSKSPTPRYAIHRGANIPVVRIASSDVTFQGFDVNLGSKAFWDVKGTYGAYSRSTGILVDHVETVLGTPDVFTNIKIQNNKVDGMLANDKGDAIKALGNATVTIQGNTIYAYGESGISATGSEDYNNLPHPYNPTVTITSNTIYGGSGPRANDFLGIAYWGGATGTADGNTIYNAPTNNGYALNSWTTMPVSFTHNTITTDGGSIGGYGAQLYQSSNLIFSNNTIEKQGLVGAIWLNPVITITNNMITNSTDGFLIDSQTSGSVTVNNNSITGIADGHHAIIVGGIHNADSGTIYGTWNGPSSTVTVDAKNNWWGIASPSFGTVISGDVNHTPWYANAGMTTLTDGATATATDATYTSTTDGQADLPAGVTTVVLDDTHNLDVSGGVNTVSGGNVVAGGATQDLSNYTGGDLGAGINLDTVQTVGDKQVTIDQAVTLQSGTNGNPILLTNSNLSNVVVSIPDGTTILAPVGWDGTIDPPKDGSSSGTAPSGFSVGSTVIDVGSPNVVLLFDQAVKITLTDVTGTVGYKPAGSDIWKTITTLCTNADVPGISFPGECYFPDGGNTIIWTYHFTSFGGLNVVTPTPPPSSGSTSGSYYSSTVTPTPTVTLTPTPEGQVLGEAITIGNPANLSANNLKEGDTVSAGGSTDPDVYIVNRFGYKRLFLNPVIFEMYSRLKNGWGRVRSIIAQTRDDFPTSVLFRNCETKDSKVYALETTGEDAATLHWVNMTGDQALAQDPEFFKKVFCTNSNEFNWYSKSSTDFSALSQVPVYARP